MGASVVPLWSSSLCLNSIKNDSMSGITLSLHGRCLTLKSCACRHGDGPACEHVQGVLHRVEVPWGGMISISHVSAPEVPSRII